MLNAIDGLAEAFGKEGYHLECASDVTRCSRAGSVIYCLADLELVHAHFPRVPPASLAGIIGGAIEGVFTKGPFTQPRLPLGWATFLFSPPNLIQGGLST